MLFIMSFLFIFFVSMWWGAHDAFLWFLLIIIMFFFGNFFLYGLANMPFSVKVNHGKISFITPF